MDVKHDIVSVMGEGVINDSGPGLDLSRATLVGSGGMCDVFRVRWRNRMVCVKRLKPEMVADPQRREALRKEFELGFSLSHRAIPQYIQEGPDYIVMDYVNGETLRSLMARKDPWLASKQIQKRLMADLVDVLEYLHAHHITHCDIKTDNVMITECARHAMLIDLGLSHADWLDTTAGDPTRFGLSATEYRGNPSVDFRALAIMVEKLGSAGYDIGSLRGFVRLCRKDGVTADELKRSLKAGWGRWTQVVAVVAALVAVCAVCVAMLMGETDAPTGQADEPALPVQVKHDETPVPEMERRRVEEVQSPGEDYKTCIADQVSGLFSQTEKLISGAERSLADGSAWRMTDAEIDLLINQIVESYSSEYDAAMAGLRDRYREVNVRDLEMSLCATACHTDIFERRQKVMQSLTQIIAARDGNVGEAR